MTIIDGIVNAKLDSRGLANRGHGQVGVVFTTTFAKVLGYWILAMVELMQFWWKRMERRKLDFATIAAATKLGRDLGGVR
jgi:hypothetical protein